jgi:hypothetical protein
MQCRFWLRSISLNNYMVSEYLVSVTADTLVVLCLFVNPVYMVNKSTDSFRD